MICVSPENKHGDTDKCVRQESPYGHHVDQLMQIK